MSSESPDDGLGAWGRFADDLATPSRSPSAASDGAGAWGELADELAAAGAAVSDSDEKPPAVGQR